MENDFGSAVRASREARNWSQEQLAALIGVTQSTIDRIEKGLTRRSRIMPELAAALDLKLPSANIHKEQGSATPNKLQRRTYILPPDLIDRIVSYQNDAGIASEDEAVRRLLDDALKHRDDIFSITARLIEKCRALKSVREGAGYVLANHPLVKSMEFEGVTLRFSLSDNSKAQVYEHFTATIWDTNGEIHQFWIDEVPPWASHIHRQPEHTITY